MCRWFKPLARMSKGIQYDSIVRSNSLKNSENSTKITVKRVKYTTSNANIRFTSECDEILNYPDV